jgi:hypothetical protein
MNRDHEQAIDILLAGNALLDLRALARNAPRDHSLRAMLDFLESTADYIAKVQAFIRSIEPTLTTRPELDGHIPAGKSADDVTFVNHAFAFAGRWSGPPGLSHKLCGACGLSEVVHPADANAAKLGEIFSAPRPYLPGAFGDHERDTREGPGSSTADDTGKTITYLVELRETMRSSAAMARAELSPAVVPLEVAATHLHMAINAIQEVERIAASEEASQKGATNQDPASTTQN